MSVLSCMGSSIQSTVRASASRSKGPRFESSSRQLGASLQATVWISPMWDYQGDFFVCKIHAWYKTINHNLTCSYVLVSSKAGEGDEGSANVKDVDGVVDQHLTVGDVVAALRPPLDASHRGHGGDGVQQLGLRLAHVPHLHQVQ
jgi:hypothetical protein